MSQATVESIFEQAVTLEPEEKRRLGALLINGHGSAKQAGSAEPFSDQQFSESTLKQLASMAWIAQNADQYVNQWVALDGDRLVTHGTDFKEVLATVRVDVATEPLLHFCEPKPERPFVRV